MARGYNKMQYNTNRYNADGTELNFTDSSTLTETFLNLPEVVLIDFAFFDEVFSIQITNKALSDEIKLADWVSLKKQPANEWFD